MRQDKKDMSLYEDVDEQDQTSAVYEHGPEFYAEVGTEGERSDASDRLAKPSAKDDISE